jgi:hypothetical protein
MDRNYLFVAETPCIPPDRCSVTALPLDGQPFDANAETVDHNRPVAP